MKLVCVNLRSAASCLVFFGFVSTGLTRFCDLGDTAAAQTVGEIFSLFFGFAVDELQC